MVNFRKEERVVDAKGHNRIEDVRSTMPKLRDSKVSFVLLNTKDAKGVRRTRVSSLAIGAKVISRNTLYKVVQVLLVARLLAFRHETGHICDSGRCWYSGAHESIHRKFGGRWVRLQEGAAENKKLGCQPPKQGPVGNLA